MFVDGKRIYYIFSILSYITTMILGIFYIYTDRLDILLFALLGLLISKILYLTSNLLFDNFHIFSI